jgi:hypothetical protein
MDSFESHNHGTPRPLPYNTIVTFPIGSFLENITVRPNGTLLISSMLSGEIFYLDPNASSPQSTILKIHDFNSAASSPPTQSGEDGIHSTNHHAAAIVESAETPDLFYTFSGQNGKKGTWVISTLDFRSFNGLDPSSVKVSKVAEVPDALWLNGATMIPQTSTLLIAESYLGQIFSYHIPTNKVSLWLEHELLGQMVERGPIPGVNGVQYFRNNVFFTSSQRMLFLRAGVEEKSGEYRDGSLSVVAENVGCDDLAFDAEGNAYVATNPVQTVVRLLNAGLGGVKEKGKVEVETVLGGADVEETAGPTAAAFGRTKTDSESLYVTTTGGLVVPVGQGGPGVARVVRVDVGVKGEGV